MIGYQLLGELVRACPSPLVAAMPGATNAGWLTDGHERGAFRVIKTRHEDTAVNAASGIARSGGTLGICSVTKGPGFGNAVNALLAAVASRTPVLLVVEAPAADRPSGQDIAQEQLTAAIGAGFWHVGPISDLEGTFRSAVTSAVRRGRPEVLSLGAGVLLQEGSPPAEADPVAPARLDSAPLADDQVLDRIGRSHRPLVLAGQGAALSGARPSLERLAGLIGAEVASTLQANAFFSGQPRNLGLCGGWAAPAAKEALRRCDLVLSFGASLNAHTLHADWFRPDTAVVQCDVDPRSERSVSREQVFLLGDARSVADRLAEGWAARRVPPPRRPEALAWQSLRTSILEPDLRHDPARGLDPRQVCDALDRRLPPDRIVVSDLGRHLGAMFNVLDARDAASWVVSRGHGSVGLGLGHAIGAAALHPDRTVVLVVGDGGFMMSLHDLDASRMNGLSLVIVVLDDGLLSADLPAVWALGLGQGLLAQPLPDVVALARSVGGTGTVVRTLAELDAVPLVGPGFRVIDARLDPEVNPLDALGWVHPAGPGQRA